MRAKRWSIVVATAVLLMGCARPGNTPAGSNPEAAPGSVTVVVSASAVASAFIVPAPVPTTAVPVIPAPARSGEASCARGATPLPSVDPSASFDVNDPEQRTRRALAEQYRATPRRGGVPEAAIPGAEACVLALRMHFTLLTSGSRTVPDERAIRAALSSAGLTKIGVRSGPIFAASTGAACVHGTLTAAGPAFAIGPLAADKSCRP